MKHLPQRKPNRLPNYDYSSPSFYYVTVVTKNRVCRFGKIKDGQMRENMQGFIVHRCWNDLPDHYPVSLDECIVMPNHFHGIIEILNTSERRENHRPRVGHRPTPTVRHGLPKIIGSFKSYSSNRINLMNNSRGTQIWQRDYYEHVIRDQNDLNRIREYIRNNPKNWREDKLNTSS